MIATWMLYCLLCAAGLSLAATLAERLLLAGRAPVRVVWVGALLLSLGTPLLAFSIADPPPPVITIAAPQVTAPRALDDALSAQPAITRTIADSRAPARGWTAIAADRLRAIDSLLIVAWVALSAALAVSLLSGVVGLAWMRRRWTERVVQGVTVHVSARTGPAVVGAIAPLIVVPEWTLRLAPSQLSLMLRHELEHLRARDGQLLIAAQIALVAMPWNVALWWQVLRLRVAIEMDCDARVLQGADARSYGELLLEFARPHRSFKLAGMIAFAERATQLERRIRVLKRHRVATSRRTTIAASTVALVALSAAWVAPHPLPPLREHVAASLPSPASLPLVVMRDVPPPAAVHVPPARASTVTLRPAGVVRIALEPCANDTTAAGATYRFLYEGISLSRESESKACALLARLVDEQLAEDVVAEASARDVRARRAAIESQRNSALLALMKTDADRAALEANINRPVAGNVLRARPAEGGIRFIGDTLVLGARVGENRAELERRAAELAKSGRVELRARVMDDGTVNTVARVAIDSQSPDSDRLLRAKNELAVVASRVQQMGVGLRYAVLFNGISLSPDDEQVAREVLTEAQEQMSALDMPARPGIRLRLNGERGVAFVASGADSALVDLAPAADRQRVRARILAVPQ